MKACGESGERDCVQRGWSCSNVDEESCRELRYKENGGVREIVYDACFPENMGMDTKS